MTHTTEELAEWACSLHADAVSNDSWEAIRRLLIDHVACAVGGSRFEGGDVARRWVEERGAVGPCTVITSKGGVDARDAAFANAAMANSLDFDDTLHGHPGATTFAVALAASELAEASGEDFLLAAIAGYEVTVRCMSRLEPLLPRFKVAWDLGALQTFGATAAVARALAVNPDVLANAWGIVSATAPMPHPRKERTYGLGVRSMLKSAYGWSASAAVTAVQMSQLGMRGPAGALDGELGLWRSTASDRGDPAHLLHGLGSDLAVNRVEHKPFMACRFLHPVIEALDKAMDGIWPTVQDVVGVRVESHSLLADEHHAIYRPGSPTEAQFSVPHVTAMMLAHQGVLDQRAYTAHAIEDAEIRSLTDRVHVNVDPDFDERFPDVPGARVTVKLGDGTQRVGEVWTVRGSPGNPVTGDDLLRKYHSLVEPVLGEERARTVAQQVNDLRTAQTVYELSTNLTPVSDERQFA